MLNTENQELLQAIGLMIDEKLDARFAEQEARFDAKLDARFAEQESRFDAKLKQLESRFDAKLDARFKQSESMLLDEIERIHMQVWDNSIKLKQLQKEISLLRSREKDFGIVYAYLNALDSRVTRLESAISPA